jgi:hypothetical protein
MPNDNSREILNFVVPILILIGTGGFTFWKLWSAPEPPVEQTVESTQSRMVATAELNQFTKLKKEHLKLIPGTPSASVPTVEELEGHYLLVRVKLGGDVKREMVAPHEADSLLSNAVAVGVQPTSLTSVGGQLQVGDMVVVVPTGSKDQAVKPFENVMVLNVVNDAKAGDKGSGIPVGITLAIPADSRDTFAAAANSGIIVTRKISVTN